MSRHSSYTQPASPGPKALRSDGRRHSIFPWSNRKSSIGSSSSGDQAGHTNNYYNPERLPVISDPVLEYSTTDFFISLDTTAKTRPVPSIKTYSPSSHAINTRNSVVATADREPPRRPSGNTISLVPEEPQKTPVAETRAQTPPETSSSDTDKTISELKRKLRESEQKSIDTLIEFQQKIDKSRKQVLELERRLLDEQRHNRELSAASGAGNIIMVPSTLPGDDKFSLRSTLHQHPGSTRTGALPPSPASPTATAKMSPDQMQVRIASLEDQRDNLRLALKGLRENKQLEAKKFQEQINRLNRLGQFQRSFSGGATTPIVAGTHGTPGTPGTPDQHSLVLGKKRPNAHHRRSMSAHNPSSFTVDPDVSPSRVVSAAAQPSARQHRPRHPSLDLSSLHTDNTPAMASSPMSSSSTRTVNSVSSASSNDSTWTTLAYQKPTTPSSVAAVGQSPTGGRRIGIGPFLPLASSSPVK